MEYEKTKMNVERTENQGLNNDAPFFTVVVPTYNQADYLGLALDSLIGQTFDNWEAVIVNDGSTDKTKEVMEKYALRDKRFRCFHKENGGVATALNTGIKNARGQWICWLSSDDLFELDKLEVHHKMIIEFPKVKFFHSHWYILIDETKQKIAPGLWLQIPAVPFQVTRFFWANYIHGNAIAVHKTVFDKVGLFDESLRQGQDFDMWLRISACFPSQFIDKRTCTTRIHQGQTTNSFVEGGVLDSTRALYKFLNERPFEALFPFNNLLNINEMAMAVREIIYISTKEDAFFYRLGFSTALVEKTLDWLYKRVNQKDRQKIFQLINQITCEYLSKAFSQEIKDILKLFNQKNQLVYKTHDVVENAVAFSHSLIKKGEQKKAAAIENYIIRITKNMPETVKDVFTPSILGYPLNDEYEIIKGINILAWYVEPGSMLENSIIQSVKIECPHCSKHFNLVHEYEMKTISSSVRFICPSCKQGYVLSDEDFDKDFVDFHTHKVKADNGHKRAFPHIAFYIRDLSTVGGGTKIVLKHVDWLIKLGCEVTIYSFSTRPDWIKINAKFVQIEDRFNIHDKNIDLFIVFSIFDVPLVLNRIPISKVVHLCQGYEGYHYGRDYEELRADKHILTKLHALPVKNIAVSTHLVDLFKEKFGRDAEYIPNGIDLKVFRYNETDAADKEPSILFIGNPNHPLKGFQFLALAIKTIQKSNQRIEKLKLNIVLGLHYDSIEEFRILLAEELQCEVSIKEKLDSTEVAGLMHESSVVVCTSWYEGFSLPLLEAMACGTPVISTRNMGAESFCIDGENSFLINYGDLSRICNTLLLVLENKYDLSELLRNALQTSLDYSELNSINAFIAAYRDMLSISFSNEKVEKLLTEFRMSEEEIIRLQKPKASLVIPVYNQLEYTKQCIESINNTVKEKVELVVVNNASSDGTMNYLNEYKSDRIVLKVVNNAENLGFPIAVNQGILQTTGKYVIIANNDIVFTGNWLKRMIEVADSEPAIGIVGPLSNEVSGLQKDENAKYASIEEMHLYAEKISKENKNSIMQFPRLAFLCTLIKRDVLNTIGGLDERFSPGNYEDDDFCLRAQLAGFKTVIAKEVFIHHYGSKSFKADGIKKYSDRLEKNKNIFIDKWGATPDEIWLQNKTINQHQYMFPINKNEYLEKIERARVNLADKEYGLALANFEGAIMVYNDSDSSHAQPQISQILNLAGNTALILGEYEKAKVYFEHELRIDPESSAACYGLAEFFFINEQFNEAKTMYEWSIKNDSSNSPAIEGLAKVNQRLGLEANDNAILREECSQKTVQEILNDAYRFFEEDNMKGAINYLETYNGPFYEQIAANNSCDDLASFFNMKGFVYLGMEDLQNALQSFEKALNTNPKSSQACVGLGEIFMLNEQYEAAKTMFEWGVKNNPENKIAVDALAKLNELLEKSE